MHTWSVMLVCVKTEVWLQSRSGQDARRSVDASIVGISVEIDRDADDALVQVVWPSKGEKKLGDGEEEEENLASRLREGERRGEERRGEKEQASAVMGSKVESAPYRTIPDCYTLEMPGVGFGTLSISTEHEEPISRRPFQYRDGKYSHSSGDRQKLDGSAF
ncbi:uncharacterized protein Triagg1_8881 [Trichoderma aggressivum f. europaeum]|uniref:Uncharacterized protein n=1 Tax=Trichoderma aggressivum f. europaeum TaxID=173218 RepID=A0AAE1LVW1_9HYPO|nr:hypothetical protein Triagg1_8881 [Trichoderma aggressivum f. europaeum]